MRTTTSFISAIAFALLVSGCGGGDDGAPGANGLSTLIAVSAEAPGAHCTNGGNRIDAGLDANTNGALDASEVGSTQYLCNGVAGAEGNSGLNTLARMLDEPAGSHCTAGGKAIHVGLDDNANGVLDTIEIDSTDYVCNGSNGASGSNGANGTNGTNGSNGTNGLNTLASVTSEPAGANCAYGGNVMRTGLDSNANGALDLTEVSSTSYACNGAPGASLSWVNVTGAAVQAQVNTGYVASNDTQPVRVTLPANPAIGDVVRIAGAGRAGWTIVQNDALGQSPAQGIYTRSLGGMAGAVWTEHDTNRAWRSVASSADGSKLVAVSDDGGVGEVGHIYTSTDGGVNWTARLTENESPFGRPWHSVASSADGSKLVASADQLYTSVNSGVNWTVRATAAPSSVVAPSAEGNKLVAVADQIYTSVNSGESWTPRESSRSWSAVASSADGSKLVATVGAGQIYTSVDSGASWTPHEFNRFWSAVASSADGSKLVATVSGGRIYTSTDSGENWTARDSDRMWSAVASSADGSKLVAVESGGQIYTSSDGGVNWTAREWNRWWRSVASSADGSQLVAAAYFGRIYTSVATTLPGAAGSISGGQFDAIELQYVGNGMFRVLSHEGSLAIQ